MRGFFKQLIVSMSLAAVVYTAPSSSSQSSNTLRNKRSFFADQGHRQYSRLNPKTWSRNIKMGGIKRSGFDMLDLDSILNDPIFMEMNEETEQHHNNGLAPVETVETVRPVKDEMSNVIPGSQGPFDEAPLRKKEQEIADTMMDDFMLFLTMKEMGMLDACLGFRRRK